MVIYGKVFFGSRGSMVIARKLRVRGDSVKVEVVLSTSIDPPGSHITLSLTNWNQAWSAPSPQIKRAAVRFSFRDTFLSR